jgi:glycosyltransferase involved in cell wall biosynthesis
MPKGIPFYEYFQDPDIKKPIEEIYSDLDRYTMETYEDDDLTRFTIDLFVLIPPVLYEGVFLKGMLFTQSADMVIRRYPDVQKLFFVMAYSMWSSYPWSALADFYFTCYNNPQRDEWFRSTNKGRGGKVHLPLEDSDYTNEYNMAPLLGLEKDIDVIAVARLHIGKNVPMIAEMIKLYREKYNKPIRLTLVVGKDFDINWSGLDESEKEELRKVEAILEHPNEYIDFVPRTFQISSDPNMKSMPHYYSRAKVCVLGSLLEGKNRSIKEAMSCNVPVMTFRQFNQYQRNGEPAFPEGGGLYIPEFDVESMADTLHELLENYGDFKPRQQYLRHAGRKKFLNICMDSIPYYENNLPGYKKGENHLRGYGKRLS